MPRDLARNRSNAPATRGADRMGGEAARNAVAQLDRYAQDFATVLPSHLNAQQWLRIAAGLLRRDPTLAATALQNPQSFFGALMDCARKGLTPGDTYHLVAFGNDVTGITDYTGEIELIYRAGMVRKIICQVVYQGADLANFEYEPGVDDRPRHRIDWTDNDRTKQPLALVYAYAEFKDGGFSDVVVMNRAQIDEVKAVAKGANRGDSPWQKWPDRMWKKTAVKQLSKWVPSSAEFRTEQLRSESAAQQTRFGQLPPSPEHVELPAGPAIDGRGAFEQPSTVGNVERVAAGAGGGVVNTATGEITGPAPAGPPVEVADPPDDAGEYDPTSEPGWGGEQP